MNLMKPLGLIVLFALGLATGLYLAQADNEWIDTPDHLLTFNPFTVVEELPSPGDRIAEKQIEVYGDRIILDIQNAQWATFTDTNSMDPIIDDGANAIEVEPESEDDVHVGDIVSYKSEFSDGWIIHRVVYKGEDEHGTYFIMKGDNIPTSDPGRVRFEQIKSVVVAIIY